MTDNDGNVPAGPQLIRALNEQLVLGHLRRAGELSRADLTRRTGLSKPTVSLTITNLERAGLVRTTRMRTGSPGPAAALYEVRPEAGFVLGLDVGKQFLRGALCDLSGTHRARLEVPVAASTTDGRIAELIDLAGKLRAEAGVGGALTQTVLGLPGVHEPGRDALALTGAQKDWRRPGALPRLRAVFGASLMIENDVNAAAMAEREFGHGRDSESFAFVSVGTGIGMGLVLDGRLRRGAHGATGEIGFLPLDGGGGGDAREARRLGRLEASASAAGIVRSARRAGLRRIGSARAVFAAAAQGDARAGTILADEAELVAKAIASIVAVVDPDLIVLGGGIGQAAGFVASVEHVLPRFAPVRPELRVSALGADAVVDGCLVAGLDRVWATLAPDPRTVGAPDPAPG